MKKNCEKTVDKKKRVLRPMNVSVTVAFAVFFLILGVLLSTAAYVLYTTSMYKRYQKQMTAILDYVEAHVDHDDMAQCAETYVESDKYKEFQAFLDDFIDHYGDVHYVYIMKVLGPESKVPVIEICTGNSTYEKENDPDMVLHLGDGDEDWYTPEVAAQFRSIMDGDKDVFITNESEWGVDYTLARPAVNSKGEHYGLLCVDVSIDELNSTINKSIFLHIGLIVVSGILFAFLIQIWIRRNVTKPIRELEKSVADYADSSAGRKDPDDLRFDPPEIRVRNEVRSLSDAITKLSEDMRGYVKDKIAAEKEKQGLEEHVTAMSEIAYRDSLTKVKNKSSYDEKIRELEEAISRSGAEFGIVMIDLNGLKTINDKYGHEHGDDYIVGSCRIICRVFKHSPVYRVGGDEFVVILEGKDYLDRIGLVNEIKEHFASSAADRSVEPWQRYSAAVGMAKYREGEHVDSVFNRADERMYSNKAEIKMKQY